MKAVPTPQSAIDAVNKIVSQLPEKIKLWRFVGKMAVDQLNKKVLAEVDNYSTREPRNPVATPSARATQVGSVKTPVATVSQKKTSKKAKTVSNASKATRSGSSKLPIPGYENQSALQIIELLAPLKKSELIAVNKFETANRARRTILNKLKTMIDENK